MIKKKIGFTALILTILTFIACNKDDDGGSQTPKNDFNIGSVAGPVGSSFKITEDGATSTCSDDIFYGWTRYNLPNLAYFFQIKTGCDEYIFLLNFNMPANINFSEIVEGVHQLNPNTPQSVDTGIFDQVYVELIESSYFPKFDGNASGTVEIRRDVPVSGTTYSVIGNLDIIVYRDGKPVNIKGQFWSKDAEWE